MILPVGALTQHIAITGKTGSGKTYTAKVIVEYLLSEGRRVCVIDPTGAWWGLRSSADGRKPGFPVTIFGGDHADVSINENVAAALADLIAGQNLPCVIDLSDFLIGQRHRFMEAFAAALHRANRSPIHLIIDEADEFAPQNPLPDTKRMLHQIDRLVRRGRIRGFRLMFITQRPAVLHKNILTQANTLIAMRLTGPQDRNAIQEWIKGQADPEEGKEVIATLPRLKQGEGWIWSPEYDVLERSMFPAITTFDSSKAPEDGDIDEHAVTFATIDLASVQARFAEAEEQARANDPNALRTRISELEKQVREASRGGATPEELRRAKEHGRELGRQEMVKTIEATKGRLPALSNLLERAAAQVSEIDSLLTIASEREMASPQPSPRPTTARRRAIDVSEAQTNVGPALRILTVLAQRYPAKYTKAQWGTLAGMSHKGGTFNTYVSRLRTAGYLEEEGKLFGVSPQGMAAIGDELPPTPTTTEEIAAMWKSAVGENAAGRVLQVLVDNHGIFMSRDLLAERVGMEVTGGSFNTYLSRLRSNGLIEEQGRDVRAAEIFFSA